MEQVFQRYETKNDPNTPFSTTRDGLFGVAGAQGGYVGPPKANVISEADI
ncbi:hypothetical protein [Sporosarcina sp. P19]|nr:hypothetical protein [Sporosarcina sp. P19]